MGRWPGKRGPGREPGRRGGLLARHGRWVTDGCGATSSLLPTGNRGRPNAFMWARCRISPARPGEALGSAWLGVTEPRQAPGRRPFQVRRSQLSAAGSPGPRFTVRVSAVVVTEAPSRRPDEFRRSRSRGPAGPVNPGPSPSRKLHSIASRARVLYYNLRRCRSRPAASPPSLLLLALPPGGPPGPAAPPTSAAARIPGSCDVIQPPAAGPAAPAAAAAAAAASISVSAAAASISVSRVGSGGWGVARANPLLPL